MRFVGLDLSLTGTGIATEDRTVTLSAGQRRGAERLCYLRDHIIGAIRWPALAIVEDYAFSRSTAAFSLGELGGVVKVGLREHGIPFVVVGTGQLKKYATGKGNAGKGLVLACAVRAADYDFGGDDNRADAWWLREMALAHYEPADHPGLPHYRCDVLAKIDWPGTKELTR